MNETCERARPETARGFDLWASPRTACQWRPGSHLTAEDISVDVPSSRATPAGGPWFAAGVLTVGLVGLVGLVGFVGFVGRTVRTLGALVRMLSRPSHTSTTTPRH